MPTSMLSLAGDLKRAETFANFFQRVRAGEEDATCESVGRYEPAHRLEIRLRDHARQTEATLRAGGHQPVRPPELLLPRSTEQFELESSERLLGPSRLMARNKIALQARKHQTLRRNHHREVSVDHLASEDEVAANRDASSSWPRRVGRRRASPSRGRSSRMISVSSAMAAGSPRRTRRRRSFAWCRSWSRSGRTGDDARPSQTSMWAPGVRDDGREGGSHRPGFSAEQTGGLGPTRGRVASCHASRKCTSECQWAQLR